MAIIFHVSLFCFVLLLPTILTRNKIKSDENKKMSAQQPKKEPRLVQIGLNLISLLDVNDKEHSFIGNVLMVRCEIVGLFFFQKD